MMKNKLKYEFQSLIELSIFIDVISLEWLINYEELRIEISKLGQLMLLWLL